MWNAAERLYRFIHTVNFKSDILSNTEKLTRLGIEEELKLRIEQKINVWHGENIEHILLETFLNIHGERFKKIHEKLHIIKDDMRGIKTPFTAYPRIRCTGFFDWFKWHRSPRQPCCFTVSWKSLCCRWRSCCWNCWRTIGCRIRRIKSSG